MKIQIVATLLLSALLVGCAPPYRQTFNDEGSQKGWTQKQTDAAFAYADRIFWSRETADNKYVIVYGKVPVSKVREQLEGTLKDLDASLDPKNKEMKQYLDTFNLREDAKHDQEVAQAIYDRLRAAELQTAFKQKMGDIAEYGPEAEMAQGYSARRLYVDKPLVDAFPFNSDVIDAARKAGTLKQVATLTIDQSNQYDHKDPNPNNPDEPNDFIWKARNQKMILTEYKIIDIDKPLDNRGDYIEGYRVVDNKQEQYPAIRVFFPPSGSMALMLIDADENGMPGFGVPDIIQEISSQTNLTDLMQNSSLINSLFDKKEAKKDQTTGPAQLFKIEIAPLGAKVDEWTKSGDSTGWIVPFKYTNLTGDNYNIRIKYKPIAPVDIAAGENAGHSHSEYLQLEYIEKEYTKTGDKYTPSAGRVIEYYRPKGDFAGKVKAQVLYNEDTKKLQFQFEDGSVVEGFVTPGKNKFIEDAPYAKSYNEGQKRYWIESSNNDGKYDKRKIVGQPMQQTGQYTDNEAQAAQPNQASANPDMDENRKPQINLGCTNHFDILNSQWACVPNSALPKQ
jgi:hypothetical protein